MADKTYHCQVTHTVTEHYRITAGSSTSAAMALGVHLSNPEATTEDGLVSLVETTKTVKNATRPRVEIADPDETEDR